MGSLTIRYSTEHSETTRAPLDEAVAEFEDALRKRGYRGKATVEWHDRVVAESESTVTGGTTVEVKLQEPEPPPAPVQPVHTYRHKGGGYYDIIVAGKVVDSVKGKANAEAWQPA